MMGLNLITYSGCVVNGVFLTKKKYLFHLVNSLVFYMYCFYFNNYFYGKYLHGSK
ncbi:hypothetical protein XIS1_1180035 [Xenorhabdus innexi]|uniref:Uncharacterized protein n=1 Tax=Xenorhabdus innexi TaxID=290109 RepID=A0A1N6MRL4_9GAMM|nr:hypothetical protein XIS1_1180035 [Xenorhabdus innexi]